MVTFHVRSPEKGDTRQGCLLSLFISTFAAETIPENCGFVVRSAKNLSDVEYTERRKVASFPRSSENFWDALCIF